MKNIPSCCKVKEYHQVKEESQWNVSSSVTKQQASLVAVLKWGTDEEQWVEEYEHWKSRMYSLE